MYLCNLKKENLREMEKLEIGKEQSCEDRGLRELRIILKLSSFSGIT